MQSGDLVSVGYDDAERTLEVEFVGATVRLYLDVSQDVFEGLLLTHDHGANVRKYFDVRVDQGGYRYLEM